MAQSNARGLLISTPSLGLEGSAGEEFSFEFTSSGESLNSNKDLKEINGSKTPKLNGPKGNETASTPITQLQQEILDQNSPAVSIDSLGFKKIAPLTVPSTDEDQVKTSPLKLKRTASTDLNNLMESASANTLNTFYSAQSIHSSASELSLNGGNTEYKSDLHDLAETSHTTLDDDEDDMGSNSKDTTVDTETLLDNINSSVTTSPLSSKKEAKFLMFTNQFTNNNNNYNNKHNTTFTTRTTASSYYGEYNDGYLEEEEEYREIDNDRTPLVNNDKFEKIFTEQDANTFEDLNKTPLVSQNGFKENVITLTSPTTEPAIEITSKTKANTSKSNGNFLSKFKLKMKGGHSRGLSINDKKEDLEKKDLTPMENDYDTSNDVGYTTYAANVIPPPPPSVENEQETEFNFESPLNIMPSTRQNSTDSTLEQKSHSTTTPIEENNLIKHLSNDVKSNASQPSHYDDDDEVHIETVTAEKISNPDDHMSVKLSPVKVSRKKSFQGANIKSPNELNKDIFESYRPSYILMNDVAPSPSSSFYPDNISGLDRNTLVSPTESTFSSTNEKRHTQVKLLNRSTANLRRINNEPHDAIEEEEEVPLKQVSGLRQVSESRHFNDLKQTKSKNNKEWNDSDIQKELANHNDDNYARLFLTATYLFDAQSLESEDDAARCLSFKKDDIAFIHDISESSGWAEVTLLSYKIETGWVPLNYFKPTIDDEDKQSLILLFKSAGNFLSNKQSRPIYSSKTGAIKGYSFPYTLVDKITVGLKYFLKEIGCLSGKNETVYLSKIIREVRKKLLQDWHILRQKAREYVGTMSTSKIELLELLVYQVLMKAIMFLNIWKSEHIFKPKTNLDKFKFDKKVMPYLQYTPTLRERIKEDSTIFFSYFSLIIGRMDLIEHNLTGVKLLKIMDEQIELLYKDFQFVVTEAVLILRDDRFLEYLYSFGKVIKKFGQDCQEVYNAVTHEFENSKLNYNHLNSVGLTYAYTDSGKKLLMTCSKLILELNKVMTIEIALSRDRIKTKIENPYLDFHKVKIDCNDFVKQASLGLLESNRFNQQLQKKKLALTPKTKAAKRFSVFRSGNTDTLTLTEEGIDLLSEMIENDGDTESPIFKPGEFKELGTEDINLTDNPYYVKNLNNEVLKDNNGVLIGSSFRGLVFILTNEIDEPSHLFISTFFLCYKIFSNGEDLLDAFISRFDVGLKNTRGSNDIRIKNRRKLVLKMLSIWLSSYWNKQDDFKLLPKLMNFLNECATEHLPLETLQMIKLIATLINTTNEDQLTPRVLLPQDEQQDSRFSMLMMSSDDDDYELTLIQSNDSLNSLASISSSTLSRSDLLEIETVVGNYKSFIGPVWSSNASLNSMISHWYQLKNSKLPFPQRALLLLNYHSLDIAKQLTLIESELFNNIKIEELLNENFTEKKMHLNLSPNVQKSILFTNSLSGYVLETILQPDIALKQRVRILTKWLKIALNCFNLKNFNSLASIMTSLQSFLISRCVKIWNLLNLNYKKLFDKLIKIIQPDKNYLIYRKKLMNYLSDKDQIIVPYLNLFLQDLTFIVEGNSNFRNAKTFLNQKLINIDKYFKITKILGDLQRLQKNYKVTISSNDYLKKSSSSSKIRKSLSRLSLSSINDLKNDDVSEIFALQELIFLELTKVHQLNLEDDDRSWKLSCLIQPREK